MTLRLAIGWTRQHCINTHSEIFFLHQCFSSSHVLLIETHVNFSKQMSTFSCILCMHCRARASAVLKIGELSLTICRFNFSRRRFVSLEFCFWTKEKFKINGTKILHVMFVCIISPVEKIFLREFCFAETYFCASRKKKPAKISCLLGPLHDSFTRPCQS